MNVAPIKSVLIESLALLLIASMVGIGVNRKLLANAWSGKAVASPPSATSQAAVPLPLGVMQVKEMFDRNEAIIIDSRDSSTYAAGHIKGALSLPLAEAGTLVPEFSGRIPKTAMLVLYCNGYSCEDSVELGRRFIAAGYPTVYYFDGGFPAWRDENYPVARGKQ